MIVLGFERIVLLRRSILLVWWCCIVTSVEAFSSAGWQSPYGKGVTSSRQVLRAATLPIPSSHSSRRLERPSVIAVQKEIDKFEKDIATVLKKLRPSETDPSIKGVYIRSTIWMFHRVLSFLSHSELLPPQASFDDANFPSLISTPRICGTHTRRDGATFVTCVNGPRLGYSFASYLSGSYWSPGPLPLSSGSIALSIYQSH
jgi:hypothetical protein